jgi:hypothetical protein
LKRLAKKLISGSKVRVLVRPPPNQRLKRDFRSKRNRQEPSGNIWGNNRQSSQQHSESALLAVIEALVERVDGISDLLQSGAPFGRRPFDACGRRGGFPSRRTLMAAATRSRRSFAISRLASSKAGQFFS